MSAQPSLDPVAPLRIAIVGAGPAGIYAADALVKSGRAVTIDLLERQPTPYGLIRYGVAPDHPRIKGIVDALDRVMRQPELRFIGNVRVGADVTIEDLRGVYDGVIVATGAERDRDLPIPGIDLPGSYGAADFVSWYDGHPDVPTDWPLGAREVAVVGAGNVALDVARVLSRSVAEFGHTEIPDHVHEGLAANAAVTVHVFARRGPAQAKFTPLELRELDQSPNTQVVVSPEDIEYDDASLAAIRADNQTRLVVKELERYALREPDERPHRLHLHFFEAPVAVTGQDAVEGLRTERTAFTGEGRVAGTGVFTDWPVQAVYRAVGYRSDPIEGLPFDGENAVVPNQAGRVLDSSGSPVAGLYVTGWIKRGPIGLIGHTKGDSSETVASFFADMDASQETAAALRTGEPVDVRELLDRDGVAWTSWDGWERIDAHERDSGSQRGRARTKLAERNRLVELGRD